MKVNKEFKHQFDEDYSNGSYAARRIIIKCILWIVIISVIFGLFGLGWKYFKTNADREIFKQSVTYNEGVLDDLAKYKFEYDKAEDDIEREAIASLVRGRFANYDIRKIENRDLVHFLKECGL